MKVILLGAGASKSYNKSSTGTLMPVAKDFFKTYKKLAIAENPWVLVGNIIRYLDIYQGISVFDFQNYNEDIEQLHSEIEEKMTSALRAAKPTDPFDMDLYLYFKAYTELIYLFASVLNEIQNGPISETHLKLSGLLKCDDVILSFNWDTLMERALAKVTSWNCFEGYYVQPLAVYQNQWINFTDKKASLDNFPIILKLHGSTNWLTAAPVVEHGIFQTSQAVELDKFCVYESAVDPYPTYDGRFMKGYSDFSYGYYPVNLEVESKGAPPGYTFARFVQNVPFRPRGEGPSRGLNSIPLIIPPVKNKTYEYFGDLFKTLWAKAEQSLTQANEIVLIGYSFPETDVQSDRLFRKAFSSRNNMPKIIIVNPEAEKIKLKFIYSYGIQEDHLFAYSEYFSPDFDFSKLE